MDALTLEARTENLDQVIDFVNERLERWACPMRTQMQIDVAVEELFVNIAHYAYAPEVGSADIRIERLEAPPAVSITLIDSGMPYDPLAREDPDITLAVENREIGGLGILMVKKSMDDIKYVYQGGKNILTITKLLEK